MSESAPIWLRVVAPSRWSIRARATVLATLVVAAALTAAAFALVYLQRRALTDHVDDTTRLRAEDFAALLSEGLVPSSLSTPGDEISFVQVVDSDGRIVLASSNLEGVPPIVEDRPPPGGQQVRTISGVPIEDDEQFRIFLRGVDVSGETYTLLVGASLEPVSESTEALRVLLQTGIPILVVLVSAGTWFLVGRALTPVERIRAEVSAITRDELGRRVPEPTAHDEVGNLARTMNGMLARLETAQERQDRFTADASHELRSPLASLRTQLEVDLMHPSTAVPEETMKSALAEVVRMQRLVEDLLLLAQSDAHGLPRRDDPVDLDDLLIAEVSRLSGRPEVGVDSSAVSAGQVRGDADQLARVLRNLIDNAWRHAAKKLTVTLTEMPDEIVLTVVDDGPGIPPDSQERVFERFSRADSARSREHGGAGLGLAICRTIVVAHGGRIWVDPDHRDGARFVVILPANAGPGLTV